MNTRVASLDEIPLAAELLKQGFPIVFPTETVYGLGAPVFLPDAVSKIFSIKGRPSDNPLIAHVHSIQSVEKMADALPRSFFLLAERFWPGPLAIILRRKEIVPSIVSAGHATIAIRMPDHEGALRLIEQVGQPLAAPSANLSGRPSPTCALDAWEDLSGKVPLILDGGPCRIGIESTVVSLSALSSSCSLATFCFTGLCFSDRFFSTFNHLFFLLIVRKPEFEFSKNTSLEASCFRRAIPLSLFALQI